MNDLDKQMTRLKTWWPHKVSDRINGKYWVDLDSNSRAVLVPDENEGDNDILAAVLRLWIFENGWDWVLRPTVRPNELFEFQASDPLEPDSPFICSSQSEFLACLTVANDVMEKESKT